MTKKFEVTCTIEVDEDVYSECLDEGESTADYLKDNISDVLQDSDTIILDEGVTVKAVKA